MSDKKFLFVGIVASIITAWIVIIGFALLLHGCVSNSPTPAPVNPCRDKLVAAVAADDSNDPLGDKPIAEAYLRIHK